MVHEGWEYHCRHNENGSDSSGATNVVVRPENTYIDVRLVRACSACQRRQGRLWQGNWLVASHGISGVEMAVQVASILSIATFGHGEARQLGKDLNNSNYSISSVFE